MNKSFLKYCLFLQLQMSLLPLRTEHMPPASHHGAPLQLACNAVTACSEGENSQFESTIPADR